MKKIITSIILFLPILVIAQSPATLRKNVMMMPLTYNQPTEKTDPYNNAGKGWLPWIVFSDRADNYTYTAPGGSLVMKKISFMDAFYVSSEKNGFLKLIKYKPGMLSKRSLKSKKSSESFGWISRDKVLQWQSAFVNPQTGNPEKAISVISGKGALTIPGVYYDRTDSLYTYGSPQLEQKFAKIALHQIVYIYKKSEDGKKFLVGNRGQLLADSAKQGVLGWVPSDAVHNFGDRLYIGAVDKDEDTADSAAVVLNNSLKLTSGGQTANYKFNFDPLIDAEEPLLRSLPVMRDNTKEFKKGTLEVGIANDVYDKTNNRVLNIKGGYLSYKDYIKIRRSSKKINLIYVVDGGSSMRNYFAGLTSTIQSFERIFDNAGAKKSMKFAGVVYRSATNCNAGGIESTPFTKDYRNLTKFLEQQSALTGNCKSAINTQPVFWGLQRALKMFESHPDETNLIVLIGSTGNADNSEGSLAEVSRQISAVNARLLSIQVYSDYNATFNDFVIQSRKLVSQSAVLLSESKKHHMVSGEGLSVSQQFNTAVSDSVSFYLDFPKNSLIQGAVIFPPKGVVKTNRAMELSLIRLINDTQRDIKTQTLALDSAFRLTGREHRYVFPAVLSNLVPPLTDSIGSSMPHNAFKYYLSATIPAKVIEDNADKLQYRIILSEEEYKRLSDVLSLMTGENLQIDGSGFRGKLFKNYMSIANKRLNLDIPNHRIKMMTLNQYIQTVTGLPIFDDGFLNKFKVADLKHKGKMDQKNFEAYLGYMDKAINDIKQEVLVNQNFISNGKRYYFINQSNWTTAKK